MQLLILLRHGKAESASSSGDDFERALTDRGRRDSALMGRVLKGEDLLAADVLPSVGVCVALATLCLAFVARTLRSAALK